jgi:hypothetical protein
MSDEMIYNSYTWTSAVAITHRGIVGFHIQDDEQVASTLSSEGMT